MGSYFFLYLIRIAGTSFLFLSRKEKAFEKYFSNTCIRYSYPTSDNSPFGRVNRSRPSNPYISYFKLNSSFLILRMFRFKCESYSDLGWPKFPILQ